MALYTIYNGASPTSAALAPVTTGTSIKTMLQVKMGTGIKGKIVEWGYSFDSPASAATAKIELIETGTVFATVTASAAADINKVGDPNEIDPTTSTFVVGTSATGFTATAEGTVTASRLLDYHYLAPATTGPNIIIKQFPLGREPVVNVSTALRIRVTFSVATNFLCHVTIEA